MPLIQGGPPQWVWERTPPAGALNRLIAPTAETDDE